jgi:hypothetical protein
MEEHPSQPHVEPQPPPDFEFYDGVLQPDGSWKKTPRRLDDVEYDSMDGTKRISLGLRSKLKKKVDDEADKRINLFTNQSDMTLALFAVTQLSRLAEPNPGERIRLNNSKKLLDRVQSLRDFADAVKEQISTMNFDQITQWKLPRDWPNA